MPYTRIVQFGDTTHLFEYSVAYHPPRFKRRLTFLERERRKKRGKVPKTARSIKRSRDNFFRLVHHNVHMHPDLPHMITLTNFRDISLVTGYKALNAFFNRLRKYQNAYYPQQSPIKFITVPEYQKNSGFLHYHAIVWGLNRKFADTERDTRILQRLWQRGYLDVRATTYKSEKLSGYLTKYFSKSQTDKRFSGRRSYTTSRNILKTIAYGSNSLSNYLGDIVEPADCTLTTEYETMYFGRCKMSIYKRDNNIQNDKN